ncbi:MAG: hypothetical protein ACFFA7_15770 [Promethearchaeota archaeon]
MTKKDKSNITKTSSSKSIKKNGKHVKIKEVENKKTSNKEEQETDSDYLSKEHLNLDIPIVPEAPKKKKKLTLDTSKLSNDVLERMKKFESVDIKVVLVNCERCEAVIPVPVPKKAVLDSDLPVVPISYVHKNLRNKDQHCLTIHLDHDFDIRRQRLSDVVIADD